jgi:hypothetical protein
VRARAVLVMLAGVKLIQQAVDNYRSGKLVQT